jgi:hypothetical protein
MSWCFRMQISCSLAETSLATLFCAFSSDKNSNIWTGLWRHATNGWPSSLQSNSTNLRLSTLHHESIFQNWVEKFILDHCRWWKCFCHLMETFKQLWSEKLELCCLWLLESTGHLNKNNVRDKCAWQAASFLVQIFSWFANEGQWEPFKINGGKSPTSARPTCRQIKRLNHVRGLSFPRELCAVFLPWWWANVGRELMRGAATPRAVAVRLRLEMFAKRKA